MVAVLPVYRVVDRYVKVVLEVVHLDVQDVPLVVEVVVMVAAKALHQVV